MKGATTDPWAKTKRPPKIIITIIIGKSHFYLIKDIFFDETLNKVKIYFEKSPFQLRKIEIINDLGITSFTILNPNFNPIFLNDKIFSLINPILW